MALRNLLQLVVADEHFGTAAKGALAAAGGAGPACELFSGFQTAAK